MKVESCNFVTQLKETFLNRSRKVKKITKSNPKKLLNFDRKTKKIDR